MPNLEETVYADFLDGLARKSGVDFKVAEVPGFDQTLFAEMIRQQPFKLRIFSVGGYFEHPSTIAWPARPL